MKKWMILIPMIIAGALYAETCPVPKVETTVTAHTTIVKPRPVMTKKMGMTSNTLSPNNTVYFQVTGEGVAPANTISPAQAMALAKRAAIADGYRQLAEKISGVRVEGRDLIRNMMVSRSTVRTHVNTILRNAKILDTKFKDGLCQVEMEVTMQGREWYARLAR